MDALKTIDEQRNKLIHIANNLDQLADAMDILGMAGYIRVKKLSSDLDTIFENLGMATMQISKEQVKTAEQNSRNVLNAALTGTKLKNG